MTPCTTAYFTDRSCTRGITQSCSCNFCIFVVFAFAFILLFPSCVHLQTCSLAEYCLLRRVYKRIEAIALTYFHVVRNQTVKPIDVSRATALHLPASRPGIPACTRSSHLQCLSLLHYLNAYHENNLPRHANRLMYIEEKLVDDLCIGLAWLCQQFSTPPSPSNMRSSSNAVKRYPSACMHRFDDSWAGQVMSLRNQVSANSTLWTASEDWQQPSL